MKVNLTAGAELDLLTPSEMAEQVDRLERCLKRLEIQRPTIIDADLQLVTDASGNLGGGANGEGVIAYVPPTGTYATLNRLSLASQLYTPTAPLATGWIAFYRGGVSSGSLVTFLPQATATVLPAVMVDGGGAKVLRNGQALVVVGASLPATLKIGLTVQVALSPQSSPPIELEA